jgi:hypothetical protein
LNLAENYQPVNELYKTADHPTLSPRICHPDWRVKTAGEFGGSGITTRKTRGKYLKKRFGGIMPLFLIFIIFTIIHTVQ